MKIKKLNESIKLVEAEDDKVEAPTPGLQEIDPQVDSVSTIADAVQDEVEITSDNEQEMTDASATQVAAKIKQAAEETNAGKVAFVPTDDDFNLITIKNRLNDILDEQLENAKSFMSEGVKAGANVLIEGLPGSGKTAIVESWCKSKGLIVVAVNATDPKLETAINGMPLRDVTKPDQNVVTIARSNLLAKLMDPANAGKCVLFVDEFNRQRDSQLRRVFLSLFNEKRNADGSLDFTKTLLFSIVCINPAGAKYHDKGTDQLNQAERSRFVDDITDFDSNAEESLAFFTGNLQKRLLKLGVVAPNSPVAEKHGFSGPYRELSEDDLAKIDAELKIYDIARFILDDSNHPYVEFTFDTRDDLADINDFNKQLFNTRKLTDLLYNSRGDKGKLLSRIDNRSNMLDKTKKMLHDILDNYLLDIKRLRKEFGIGLTDAEREAEAKAAEEAAKTAKEVEKAAEEAKEDDDEFFEKPTSGKQAVTPGDAETIVNDALSNW